MPFTFSLNAFFFLCSVSRYLSRKKEITARAMKTAAIIIMLLKAAWLSIFSTVTLTFALSCARTMLGRNAASKAIANKAVVGVKMYFFIWIFAVILLYLSLSIFQRL